MRTALPLGLVGLALFASACSGVVDFDRSRVNDGGMDAPMGTCDPSTHAGCRLDQLCCDDGGQPTCVATGAGQCAACGVACDARSSSACVERTCRCGDGAACGGDADRCDDATGTCIECTDASECSGAQQCVDGRCAACDPRDDAGCSGATPICDASSTTCRACAAGDCAAPLVCLESGECGGCTENEDCTSRTAPICDTESTVCRGCADAPECMTELGRPFCLGDGRCTVCDPADSAGCSGATPICRMAEGALACAACADGDCAGRAGTPVCAETGASAGACVACDADDASVCAALGQVCDVTSNRCVQCLTNAQCGDTTPICGDGTCRACSEGDCTTGVCVTTGPRTGACGACNPAQLGVCPAANPVCASATATCVDCTADAQCTGLAGGPTCVLATGECALCDPVTSVGCSGTTPFCADPMTCRACANDTECEGSSICRTNGACAVCDPSNGRGCTASGTQPICAGATPACRACASSTDCSGNPSGAICVLAGDSAGACRPCRPGAGAIDDGCTTAAPTCSSGFTCVACEVNADCPASGFDCVSGQCQCRAGASGGQCQCSPGNNCTPGQLCNRGTGTCGAT